MTTVREAALELFRERGMTTIFGNPGSTELPMLAGLPSDFRYILGLQEAVVVGMADGYAQATGRVAHANLHTAPGLGNAMGAIFNAQANKAPLLITAGQQVRAHLTMQANLSDHRATEVPHPYVKWSFEPPRAQDVPAALARATSLAGLPPAGPAFVSLPMDDWGAEVDAADARRAVMRRVGGRAGADPEVVAGLARRLEDARRPVLVAGPGIDAAGAWDAAVALAEHQRLPVLASPPPAATGSAFPRTTRSSRASWPRPSAPPGRCSRATTSCSWSAPRSSPTTPTCPGPRCPRGPSSSRSPTTPTRPPARPWATRSSPTSGSPSTRCSRCSATHRPTGRRRRCATRRPRPRPRTAAAPTWTPATCTASWPACWATTPSSCSNRRRAPWPCATACASRAPAATGSAPRAGWASGCRPRSASSSLSPAAAWSASWARARPNTRSPASGPPPPIGCP
nr:thiamine pyrophosphate-binding protein [Baekduia soli]